MQQAMISYVLASVNAKKGKKFRIEDFMQVKPKPQQQSQPMIKSLVRAALGFGRQKEPKGKK